MTEETENSEEFIIEIEEDYSSGDESDNEGNVFAKNILDAIHKLGIKSKITIVENRIKRKVNENEQKNDTGYDEISSDEELRCESPGSVLSSWTGVASSPTRPAFSLSPFLHNEEVNSQPTSQQLHSYDADASSESNDSAARDFQFSHSFAHQESHVFTYSGMNSHASGVPMSNRNLPASFWIEPSRLSDGPGMVSNHSCDPEVTTRANGPQPPMLQVHASDPTLNRIQHQNAQTYFQHSSNCIPNQGLMPQWIHERNFKHYFEKTPSQLPSYPLRYIGDSNAHMHTNCAEPPFRLERSYQYPVDFGHGPSSSNIQHRSIADPDFTPEQPLFSENDLHKVHKIIESNYGEDTCGGSPSVCKI